MPGTPDAKFYDRFPGVPAVNPWVGTRTFDAVDDIPNWKDINPRFGVSYDLFGNGRTALKFSVGRYVAKTNVDVAVLLNPITTAVNTATRSLERRQQQLLSRTATSGTSGRTASAARSTTRTSARPTRTRCAGPTP